MRSEVATTAFSHGATAAEGVDPIARLEALAGRRRAAIRRAFTRLHALALGCAIGATTGLLVTAGTLVLVAKGGGIVGFNLRSLASYFPGYAVDVPGALVGGAYGFAFGFVAGWSLAAFRNLALRLVLGWTRFTAERWRRHHMLDEI